METNSAQDHILPFVHFYESFVKGIGNRKMLVRFRKTINLLKQYENARCKILKCEEIDVAFFNDFASFLKANKYKKNQIDDIKQTVRLCSFNEKLKHKLEQSNFQLSLY